MNSARRGVLFFTMCLVAGVWACSDDEMTDNEYVNRWIRSQMKTVYLWNEGLPSPRKSQNPALYFEALKSSEDRFSWIQENYQELINSLNGVNKEAGYEFKLYGYPDNNNIDMQIMYIKSGSLIETNNVNLMRGDVITEVNGRRLTRSNYQDIVTNEISETHTVTYSRFNRETDTWQNMGEVTLHTNQFAENPNLMHTVFTIGDRKIGYYVYNFFAEGPTEGSYQYDNEMDNIFSAFKADGITDLVIDFRFNSGGSIASSVRLASYIGANTGNNVFTKFQYNDDLQEYFLEEYGEDELQLRFINLTNNVGSLINGRVYFLTSKRTASASELVINGLKPFMNQIILIGDTTVGKNVGSTSIYEKNDPRNTWGMQPIIVKLYNGQNEADYDEGFVPQELLVDNELELYPLGDENERLLSRAIDMITGGAVARKGKTGSATYGQEVAASADFKRGGYNLLMNDDVTREGLKKRTSHIPGSF